MEKAIKQALEIIIPIFNAYLCMFGILGIYIFSGGKLEDRLGFLIIPLIVALIYGAYVGYKAIENVN